MEINPTNLIEIICKKNKNKIMLPHELYLEKQNCLKRGRSYSDNTFTVNKKAENRKDLI